MKGIEGSFTTLLEHVSNGDEVAFGEIFHHFNNSLIRFATNLVRSPELAEEIVEDVFVKLWLRRTELRDINNLNTYLFIATKNRSLNTLYKDKLEFTDCEDLTEVDTRNAYSSPLDNILHLELMDAMKVAVDALPERCRVIFKLVREEGLKYKEVAEILDISVNTIDAQMAIAIKRICASLGINKESKKIIAS